MTSVLIRDNENFEKALRRFSKSCERSGILADVKKHQHFEKPSERKKRKMAAARRKSRRKYW
jgi:small subunit ribosomal protein S21